MISNHSEGTFGRLRYSLGGDRPSQTAHLTMSQARIHGPRLESQQSKSGIPTSTPYPPKEVYEESVLKDENGKAQGFVLPESVAPYKVQIVPKMDNQEKVKEANELYTKLSEKGIGAILDDRNISSIGVKIKDCKVLGTPYMAVLGDKVEAGKVELENVRTGEKEIISVAELVSRFNK